MLLAAIVDRGWHISIELVRTHTLLRSRLYDKCRERKCAENYNKQHNEVIFQKCSQHFANF